MKIYSLKASERKFSKPILFVHGVMHGAWCWQKYYMPYFQKQGFDVFAIDLSNHYENQKDKSLKFTTLSDYVQDVKEAVDYIGEECILIGHSMGGMILQKYLVNHACSNVVLITPTPPRGVFSVVFNLIKKHPIKFLMANIKMSLLPIFSDKSIAKEVFFGYTMEESVLNESFAKVQDESFLAFLGILFPFLKKPKQQTNILVIGAENDNAVSLADNRNTVNFHSADYKLFKNMAHDMMLEKEWQKPADHIIEWINQIKK